MDTITEQLLQRASETRKKAKVLQRQLETITDPDERKQIARQMNDLFAEASRLREEAQERHGMEESVEREFLSIKANLEED